VVVVVGDSVVLATKAPVLGKTWRTSSEFCHSARVIEKSWSYSDQLVVLRRRLKKMLHLVDEAKLAGHSFGVCQGCVLVAIRNPPWVISAHRWSVT
jgi:hypothetical protein